MRVSVVGTAARPWTALKKRASLMSRRRSSSDFQPRSCSMAVTLLRQDESPTTKPLKPIPPMYRSSLLSPIYLCPISDDMDPTTTEEQRWFGQHYVNFAMRRSTASKGGSGGQKPRKLDSSLSGHWMGHLLSYSLSGGHDGAMLPINPRGLNGPLTSHFTFSSHMYFSLNIPTHYWSPMPN